MDHLLISYSRNRHVVGPRTGRRTAGAGFTLIELMIVVAIIGVLASIAIPKFANLVTRSKEAAVRGQLGSVRSAVNIYYADNEGIFPSDPTLGLITNAKYLSAIPGISIPGVTEQSNPGHALSNLINNEPTCGNIGDWNLNNAWKYFGNMGLNCFGQVMVHCSHNDTHGNSWTSY